MEACSGHRTTMICVGLVIILTLFRSSHSLTGTITVTFDPKWEQYHNELRIGCYNLHDLVATNFTQVGDSFYPPALYDDQRVGMFVETAFSKCRSVCSKHYGHNYFSLKRNTADSKYAKCYCGNNFTDNSYVDAERCSFQCGPMSCGGSRWSISLYSVCVESYFSEPAEADMCERRCHCAGGERCSLLGRCPDDECQAGWTGLQCNIDIDECVDANCSHFCNNNEGGYMCGCRTGYSSVDGNVTCTDIDECTNHDTCKQGKETCWNTPGSFSCCPVATNYDPETDLCLVPGEKTYLTWIAVGSTLGGVLVLIVAILGILLYKTRKPGEASRQGASSQPTEPIQRPDSLDMTGYHSIPYNRSTATRELPPVPRISTPAPLLATIPLLATAPSVSDQYLTPPGFNPTNIDSAYLTHTGLTLDTYLTPQCTGRGEGVPLQLVVNVEPHDVELKDALKVILSHKKQESQYLGLIPSPRNSSYIGQPTSEEH